MSIRLSEIKDAKLRQRIEAQIPAQGTANLGLVSAPVHTPESDAAASRAEAKAERDIQDELDQWLRLHGYFFIRPRMDKRSQLPNGWPDFTILLRGGKCCFIEVKTYGGRCSPDQVRCHAELRSIGHKVCVSRYLPQSIAFIREVEDL